MKPASFDHLAPESLDEALALLAVRQDDAKILAGGQSLVPMLALRLAAPALLIDLNRIAGLSSIQRLESGELVLGATTRQRAIEHSDIVARANPLLAAALPWIAHVPIRNRGTIGGSLAHADPSAELPAVSVACEATLVAQSRRGRREIAAADFFLGLFQTALAADEVLTEVRFLAWPQGRSFGFFEVARRRGDFAILGVATVVDSDPDGRVRAARIVAFGATDRPVRLETAERLLTGSDGGDAAVSAAARSATDRLAPRGDHHASAEYRLELAEVLTRRALAQALQRTAG